MVSIGVQVQGGVPVGRCALCLLRPRFPGTYITNGGLSRETGNAAVAAGEADLVAYGVP